MRPSLKLVVATAAAIVAMIIGFFALERRDGRVEATHAARTEPRGENDVQPTTPPAEGTARDDSSILEVEADATEQLNLEREHASHPVDHQANARPRTESVIRFAEETNQALDRDPRLAHLGFSVQRVDCRRDSCLAYLRFKTFAAADAFFRMLEDGRLAKTLKGVAKPGCPPRRRAIPRIPGAVQPNALAILQFACD